MPQADCGSSITGDSQQQQDRRYLKELLNNVWPKDPLEEQREMMRNTEMIEISDLMDAISRD